MSSFEKRNQFVPFSVNHIHIFLINWRVEYKCRHNFCLYCWLEHWFVTAFFIMSDWLQWVPMGEVHHPVSIHFLPVPLIMSHGAVSGSTFRWCVSFTWSRSLGTWGASFCAIDEKEKRGAEMGKEKIQRRVRLPSSSLAHTLPFYSLLLLSIQGVARRGEVVELCVQIEVGVSINLLLETAISVGFIGGPTLCIS